MNREIKLAMFFFGTLLSFYIWLGGIVQVKTLKDNKNDYELCII